MPTPTALAPAINAGLVDYARRHNLDSIARLVGTLETNAGAQAWTAA